MEMFSFSDIWNLPPGYSCGSIALSILLIVAYWMVFKKAGQPGWGILIPIYNIILLLRVANKPWWWILLFLIPGVNIVFMIWMLNRISLSFDQESWFTIGLIFLPFIFFPILAFSKNMVWTKLPE